MRAARIEARLKAAGDPDRAEPEKRYLKSDLTFFGTRMADVRRIAKALSKEQPEIAEVVSLAEELWAAPVFERRITAVVLLGLRSDQLGPGELPVIERFIRESKTWALVDGLAVDAVGGIALRHRIKGHLDRWARDEDFWIRRSSMLAEMKPLKQGASFGPFAARADALLEEKEFFIRKAIGWVLRETSKKRPHEVWAWIAPRTHRASGVTMREAVKYLSPTQREALTAAYKAGRPAL